MATTVVTIAPHRDMSSQDPGPSTSTSRQPHPPPSGAKSFKRLFRSSLQDTLRHGRKDKEKEKEKAKDKETQRATQGGVTPPSAFMDYLHRPSLFRRSAESQNREAITPVPEDGRRSATPSVSSTTASGAERRPRVLRKPSGRPRAETPETTTLTNTKRSSGKQAVSLFFLSYL